jgi:hypothetical protein
MISNLKNAGKEKYPEFESEMKRNYRYSISSNSTNKVLVC